MEKGKNICVLKASTCVILYLYMYIYILFSQKCKCSVFASNSLIDFAQKSLEGEPAVGMDMSMKNKLNTKRISVASQLTEQMLFFWGGGA